MRKTSMVACMVATLMVFFAAAMLTGCDNKSSEEAYAISTRYRGYSIVDGKIVAIDNDGNPHDLPEGLLPELRAERTYKEEGTTPLAAQSLAPSQLNTASPATTKTSFPYNYGINNEVTAVLWLQWNGVTLRPLDTLFVRGYHVVDNTATGPFVEQSHTQYTLCWADGTTVEIYGDSISCRQNFSIREVLPTVIHDTVWQERVIHDTLWRERVIHDTIHQIDTVWQERIVHDTVVDGRWVDSVVTRRQWVVSHNHVSTNTTDTYTPSTATYQVSCTNRTDSAFTERLYLYYSDHSVDSSRVRNWTHSVNWQKIWSRSVTLNGSNPGSGRVTISGGTTANFGAGNSIVFGTATITTNPAGFTAATNCTDVLMYATAVTGGVNIRTVVNHGGTGDSTQGFIPWNGTTPPPPPTITSTDTVWGECGTANAWYQALTDQVKANVTKAYSLARLWSDSHTDTIGGYTATVTYTWDVIRSGQATAAMITTTPQNGNPASFGGGAFTEGLTQVGSQRFCPLSWTSATLTGNTTSGYVNWTGSYNGQSVTVSVPETFTIDTSINVPGNILFVGVTLSVQNDINPGMVTPEYYVNVVYSAGGTVHHRIAPLVGFHSGASFTDATVSATVAQIQSYVTNGQYPAKCYNHVTQNYVLGTVNEVTSGSAWVIQWFSYINRSTHYNTINSISNVFVDGEHPAIILGSFITSDGTITINGVSYTFTGSNL